MKKKKMCLFIGIILLVGLCIIAAKTNLSEIVRYKVEDIMTDTMNITYVQEKFGFARAVVSPDRSQLAFCKEEEEFFVKDLSTGNVTTYPARESVFQVKYSPDGRYLAAGRNILNTKTGEVTSLPTQANPGDCFDEIAFSPNGELLAIVNDERGPHPTRPTVIEIWKLQTKELIQKFTKDRFLIYQMSFSPDGHYLAVAGNEISLWDTQTGKCVKTLDSNLTPADNIFPSPDNYEAVAYSPDGKHLAAVLRSIYSKDQRNKGSQTESIEIWDTEQGTVVKTLDWGSHYNMEKLQYSPDGQFIASGKTIGYKSEMIGDAVWIWDVNRGQVIKKLTQFPYGKLTGMDYSADGNYVSASTDHYTKIWRVK